MVNSADRGNEPPPSARATELPRQEILPYTALRGLAAWWVALYHFDTILPFGGVFERIIINGPLAVDLFFVMSGYVLALSYGAQFATRVEPGPYARFLTLRLGRIYPLHIVVVVLFLSVPISLSITGRAPLDNQFQPDTYIENIFLVQNWLPGSGLDWNVPAWSISAEFMFYLLFPILARLTARIERVSTLLLAGLALLILIASAYGSASYINDFSLRRCLPECLLGMLLFRAASRIRLPSRASSLLFTAFLVLVALNAAHLASDQATMPAAFACLLWTLLDPRFWLSRFLSNPVLLWLGHVSFSTYLIHFLVKYWMKFLLVGTIPGSLVFVLYIAVVALASWALHHAVELPGRKAGRAFANLFNAPNSSAITQGQPIRALLPGQTREPGL